MGSEYSCQSVESEEETVNKIFKEMFKKEIQSGSIYDNFIKCIIYYPNLKKLKLNKKLFSNFLSYVLEENPYVEIYKEYFFSIIRNHDEIESIKKIGLILIENAIGIDHAKLRKKYYMEHFTKFYLENLIEKAEQRSSHFSFALGNDNSFYSNFNNENKDPNTRTSLYYKKPFSAELDNYSKLSFDELKISCPTLQKNNSNDYIFINKSNIKGSKIVLENLDSYNNHDFNSSNFNFNATQNPNFISFIKKKELENLDNQIINLISDVIENNTNCLNYALKNIFSRKRLETLEKSWPKNNKKLLLLEIHRNYTSLVEKICLFPAFNSDTNKRYSHKNFLKDEAVKSIFTPRNNSSKIIKVENANDQFEFGRLSTEEDVNKKSKFHKELEDFFLIKERLISNFFELTETQLAGDAIRNWLYENSKN